MTLVDTSAWILALRRRNARAALRVRELVSSGQAAICPVVLLEWMAGRATGEDAGAIRERFRGVVLLPCTDSVWERAYLLAAGSRDRGHTLGPSDALVAAHALEAGARLLHGDRDFSRMAGWAGLDQESLLTSEG